MNAEQFDIGNSVECDFCCNDYTKSTEVGGLLFESKAVCPKCAEKVERDAERYGETHLIRQRCPANISFRDFVLFLRGGNNTVTVFSGE